MHYDDVCVALTCTSVRTSYFVEPPVYQSTKLYNDDNAEFNLLLLLLF